MFALLNNLSIRSRTTISVLLFILTLLYSMYGAYTTVQANIDFAVQEDKGAVYQLPLNEILTEAGVLEMKIAQKNVGLSVDMASNFQSIDDSFARLQKIHQQYGADLKLTSEELGARDKTHLLLENVLVKWDALKGEIQKKGTAGIDAVSAFRTDIKDLVSHVGDMSSLILDPDLDSYYLMDAYVLALPQTLHRIASVGSYVFPNLMRNLAADQATITEYAVFARLLTESDIGRVVADMGVAFNEDPNFYGVSPTLESTLRPLLEDYSNKNQALVKILEQLAKSQPVSARNFAIAWDDAMGSAFALTKASEAELDHLLQARIADYKGKSIQAILISLAGIAISMFFFQLVVQSVIGPLKLLTGIMKKLTANDLSADVPYREAKSEIGEIAASVEVFKKNAMENKRLEKEKIDSEQRAEMERVEMMSNLANSFESRVQGIISSVAGASTELSQTAELMSKLISESNDNAQAAVKDSAETSSNVQSVTAAAEEMSSTIQEISSQTQGANNLIMDSVKRVESANALATELQTASQQVRNVVQLISSIASQTNLLALNATIESARAGEAGRGFAVVANEVRALAGQTEKSVQDIEKVIADMTKTSDGVIAALVAIKEAVDRIHSSSTGIASAVEEQSAVVNDIAQNMTTATHKTQTVQRNIEGVGRLSGEADQSSRQVLQAANDLSRQAEQLDSEVNKFLAEIRKS